jgi:hypothetical protein
MDLQAYLNHCESILDPKTQLLGVAYKGHHHHSAFSDGAWVHQTRESLDYALALLATDHPQASVRVPKIVWQVLALQETDSTKATYGIWPWLFEEPLELMVPPDWNWADFIGVRLAHMLKCHLEQLPGDLIKAMRDALEHAAWSIFRRNVQAGYSNIAVMGAACTAAAGELLHEPQLLRYAQLRLKNVIDHVAQHGSLTEYNSPTYTTVLLEECSRIFVFCEDPLVRDLSHALLVKAWEVIGEHYHPATNQWAGPHARAYDQLLNPYVIEVLSDGLGRRLPIHPFHHGDIAKAAVLVPTQPCPEELKPLFSPEKTASPFCIRRQFTHNGDILQIGTTWMNDTACLGSISIEDNWNQRRPVLAYWKTPADPAVSLRVRLLHDGYDFASGMIRTHQQDNRVLMAWNLLNNRGDTHIGLDKRDKPIYTFQSLALQWEFVGQGVTVEKIDENRFAFRAGDTRAILHIPTGGGSFNGHQVIWQSGQMEHGVTVTATCYQGPPVDLDMSAIRQIQLACGLEIIPLVQTAESEELKLAPFNESGCKADWCDLSVEVPQACQAYIV